MNPNTTVSLLLAHRAAAVLQHECHGAAKQAGWWTDLANGADMTCQYRVPMAEKPPRNIGELLMLIVSEVAEAMEGARKGLMDDKLPHRPMLEAELADAVIRIFDTAGGLGLDLPGAVADKLEYNAARQDHKIEHRRAAGGKKF